MGKIVTAKMNIAAPSVAVPPATDIPVVKIRTEPARVTEPIGQVRGQQRVTYDERENVPKRITQSEGRPEADNKFQTPEFEILRNEYEELQNQFPSLKKIAFEEAFGKNTDRAISDMKGIQEMLAYFKVSQISNVSIDRNHAIDRGSPGSSANVYPARIDGNPNVLVAKVYKNGGLRDIAYAMREGMYLSIAAKAQVGPGFFGYSISENGELIVLMKKVEGRNLSEDGYRNVNSNTIESFREQMKRLHELGYTFAGDGGQMMIQEDGSVKFIDIVLIPLSADGKVVSDLEESVLPEHEDRYMEKMRKMHDAMVINEACKNETSLRNYIEALRSQFAALNPFEDFSKVIENPLRSRLTQLEALLKQGEQLGVEDRERVAKYVHRQIADMFLTVQVNARRGDVRNINDFFSMPIHSTIGEILIETGSNKSDIQGTANPIVVKSRPEARKIDLLENLRNNDPEGYEIIKNNDLAELKRT